MRPNHFTAAHLPVWSLSRQRTQGADPGCRQTRASAPASVRLRVARYCIDLVNRYRNNIMIYQLLSIGKMAYGMPTLCSTCVGDVVVAALAENMPGPAARRVGARGCEIVLVKRKEDPIEQGFPPIWRGQGGQRSHPGLPQSQDETGPIDSRTTSSHGRFRRCTESRRPAMRSSSISTPSLPAWTTGRRMVESEGLR